MERRTKKGGTQKNWQLKDYKYKNTRDRQGKQLKKGKNRSIFSNERYRNEWNERRYGDEPAGR